MSKKFDEFNKKSQFNENDRRWSIILSKAIQKKRLTKSQIKLKNWVPYFEKLRKEDEYSPSRIEKVLKWFINHLRNKYTPKAFSAKSFRAKFLDIESAMEQDQKQMDLFEDDFEVTVIQDDDEGFEYVIHYDMDDSEGLE